MTRRPRFRVKGAMSGSTCTVMTSRKNRLKTPSLCLFAIRVERKKKAMPVSPNCRLSRSSSAPRRLLLRIHWQSLIQPCHHRRWTQSSNQHLSPPRCKPISLWHTLYSPGSMVPACRPVAKHLVHLASSDQKPRTAHPPKAQIAAPRLSAPVSPKPAATPLLPLPPLTCNTFPAAQPRASTYRYHPTKMGTPPTSIPSSPRNMPSPTFNPLAGPLPPRVSAVAPSSNHLSTPLTAQMDSQPPITLTAPTLPSPLPPPTAPPSRLPSTAPPRLSHNTSPPLHQHPYASRPRPRPRCLRKCCPTPFPRRASTTLYAPSAAMP